MYNVSFDMTLPRFLNTGFVTIDLSPVPTRVSETVDFVMEVIRSIQEEGVDALEFQEVGGKASLSRMVPTRTNAFAGLEATTC